MVENIIIKFKIESDEMADKMIRMIKLKPETIKAE